MVPLYSGGHWFLVLWCVIAFDYGDRTIRLGDIEEAEARRVVDALRAEGLG